MTRRADRADLGSEQFDLAIVGGGITGAGLFREATDRGYRCLLLERGDFASGTSSRSANLVHGGLRYLRQGKLGLVRESLAERRYLLETYPHLVEPIPFLLPVYRAKYRYRLGMAVYRFLSRGDGLPAPRFLGPEATLERHPFVDPDGLRGSFLYHEAVTDDARLCNEVIHSTAARSDSVALNYCEVLDGEPSADGVALTCADHLEGDTLTARSNYVVNATGVWSDEVAERLHPGSEPAVAPSKGVHLVLSREALPVDTALVFPSVRDDRSLYAIPWRHGSVVVGTTDTEYRGDPDALSVDPSDVAYLLEAVQAFAPGLEVTGEDVISAYAGLRPLLAEERTASVDRSRDYRIWWNEPRVLHVVGGKLTTFHAMAEALVAALEERYEGERTGTRTGATGPTPTDDLPPAVEERLRARYPERDHPIWRIAAEDAMQERVHPRFALLAGELVYLVRHQQCHHLDDLLTRRCSLTYVLADAEGHETLVERAADLMQRECGWSDEEREREVERYLAALEEARPPS